MRAGDRKLGAYGVAIATTGIALLLSLSFSPLIDRTIGAFFYIAIALTSWYGGWRPGLVAIGLAAIAINFYFLRPLHQVNLAQLDDVFRLLLFVGVALIMTGLSTNLRASRRKIEILSQQAAAETEGRLQTALHAAQMGMWDWDLVTGAIRWSPEHELLFGLAPGTFDGHYRTFEACLHPADRADMDVSVATALQQRVPYCHEFRVVWPDGSVHWIEGRGRGFYDAAGQPVRLTGTAMAIDERKQTELALQALTTELEQRVLDRTIALQQTADLLQRFFEAASSAQIGLCIQDQELRFVQINEALAAINGYSVAAHLGKTSTELMPDLAPMIDPLFRQVLTTGEPILNLELTAPAPSQPDEVRSWLASYFPIEQPQAPGTIAGVGVIIIDISARKRAEMALQQSMHEVEDLYNHAPCGYHSLDATGKIVRMNETELMWLGYTQEEVLNRPILEFLTPESQQVFRNSFPQFKQLGWVDNLELEFVTQSGATRWLNVSATALTDAAGQFLVSRSSTFDISDRRHAEALIYQQTRQKQLLWTITQAMRQSLDRSVMLQTVVTAIRPLLNLDRVAIYQFNADWSGDFIVESVRFGWRSLVSPDSGKTWADTYWQDTQNGRFQPQATVAVTDIYTADLPPCELALLAQFQVRAYAIAPIFLGDSLWGLLALYHNALPYDWQSWELELLQQITSQLAIAIQQAELYSQLQIELQERQQTAAVLSAAERRWRSLLDQVQLVVVGLDQAGRINYVNPFCLTLTGFTASELLGQDWSQTFMPASRPPGDPQRGADGTDPQAHPYYQAAILTKTGEERLIAWNNTRLQGVDGTAIGTISIGQDITERQKVEKLKDEFIGIVSHELRTPLTAIQMSLSLVQSGVYAQKPDKAQRMIEIALADTHRLVNLVNDILDLERLESGRLTLERSICDAMDLMQAAVDGVQAIAQQHAIQLQIEPTRVQVWAAADSILQTLTNLLSNAIKFSPPHSTVVLTAVPQLEAALFQVRDHGRGIPEDKLETIFGRFQQVDASDSREKGGTGLGLPICRTIIERHGGKIWAESTLGAGSTFCFTLPLATLEQFYDIDPG